VKSQQQHVRHPAPVHPPLASHTLPPPSKTNPQVVDGCTHVTAAVKCTLWIQEALPKAVALRTYSLLPTEPCMCRVACRGKQPRAASPVGCRLGVRAAAEVHYRSCAPDIAATSRRTAKGSGPAHLFATTSRALHVPCRTQGQAATRCFACWL
jgi:hypothetical protein